MGLKWKSQVYIIYKEEMLYNEGAEMLEQVAQRSCRFLLTENV